MARLVRLLTWQWFVLSLVFVAAGLTPSDPPNDVVAAETFILRADTSINNPLTLINTKSGLAVPSLTVDPNFFIRAKFKPSGQVLRTYDVWVALVRYMSDAALQIFNAPIQGVHQYKTSEHVGLDIVGNTKVGEPPLRNKHLQWSMVRLMEFWETQAEGIHYAETNFVAFAGDAKLGVGKVYALLTAEGVVPDPAASNLTGDLTSGGDGEGAVIVARDSSDGNVTISSDALGLPGEFGDTRCKLTIAFEPGGQALCPPVAFFRLLMAMLLSIAEHDNKQATYMGSRIHDEKNDFTFEISATSKAAAFEGRLKVDMVIAGIRILGSMMAKVDGALRFHDFTADMQWDRRNVGTFVMYKGKPPD